MSPELCHTLPSCSVLHFHDSFSLFLPPPSHPGPLSPSPLPALAYRTGLGQLEARLAPAPAVLPRLFFPQHLPSAGEALGYDGGTWSLGLQWTPI